MGGDDLASDDEYLADSGLVDDASSVASSPEDDDGEGVHSGGEDCGAATEPALAPPSPPKKRKGTTTTSSGGDDDDDPPPPPEKINRRGNAAAPTSSRDVLLRAGRGVASDGPDAQATFLGALYSHSIKLSGGVGGGASSGGSGIDGREEGGCDGDGGRKFSYDASSSSSSSFSFLPHLHVAPPDGTDAKARRHRHSDLAAFLKSGPLPSNKRLKNWKHPRSPMVIIVTLSARRSVELMRQLSSLKLPVAKLFAKHMSVEDQVGLLRGYGGTSPSGVNFGGGGGKKRGGGGGKYYSLAVGTPGRLLKLLRHDVGNDGGGGGGGAPVRGGGSAPG